jgi:hypothetical protein
MCEGLEDKRTGGQAENISTGQSSWKIGNFAPDLTASYS